MRTLATGQTSRLGARQRGVTLVELLVVLMIIAMIASVVILSAPPARGDARLEGDRFAARVDYAASKAVTAGVLIGLEASDGGYRFYEYARGVWSPAADAKLGAETFSADLAVEMAVSEPAKRNEPADPRPRDDDDPAPNVFFAPTGETTPFAAMFRSRSDTIAVALDAAGKVQVSEANE
jgi:general secretion pathway protein H